MRIPERPPKLSEEYSYTSIVNDLFSTKKLEEFFEINNNQYPYWDKWKYIAKQWQYDPKKLWAAIKHHRRGGLLYFSPQLSLQLNAPSVIQQYLHEFDMNLGGTLQGENIIPSEDRERYLINSLMEEAIASSQLEGAVTTHQLAREMLESNRKPRNHSEQMILNNYEAMKWIVDNKHLPFTLGNLLQLHAIVTNNTLRDKADEGRFRTDDEVNVVDVQTGEVVHYPPPHTELLSLMKRFCDFANDKVKQFSFVHPISKGIVLHFLIGFIHPFVDGNGRTARTIFYWYLLKKGYWLIEYMSVSRVILNAKAQYARAYLHTELDENDLTYFVLYNAQCIQKALEELKQHIKRKTAERKNVMDLLRNTDFNERQIVLLQELMQDSGRRYSVSQIEKWFDISNQTARNDLNGLVEAGLLAFRKTGKKIQFFAVKDFGIKVRKK
ncbi:MAG: Fic family protein [Chitinophagaceae bacterium]